MEPAEGLLGASRLAAVRAAGVGPVADTDLERFARLASAMLDVPVALVSIVEAGRQVFPGQVGLPEPWASARETPLTHSLCQFVAASREPLVVADTRLDPLTRDSLAIPDLDVVAYAGMPLVDSEGEAFGSLCAIDHEPRTWTSEELALLTDLAGACSAELRLRIAARRAAAAHSELERSNERAELMLRAATELGRATSLSDLRHRVRELVGGPLRPVYVGLSLVRDDDRLVRVSDPEGPVGLERNHPTYELDAGWPTARCISLQRTIVIEDEDQLLRDGYDPVAVDEWRALGIGAATCVPLVGSHRVLGAIAFCWDGPHAAELTEEAVLSTIAGYAATAVARLVELEQRVTAATELQAAMLTAPITVPGLEIATLYRTSAAADMVGGDWYDVHLLTPQPPGPDAPDAPVVVTIGDITGHDMRAAAVMGQARSMLRQAGIDAPGHSPARALTSVQRAAEVLDLDLSGTAVHGHLRPTAEGWELVWTNAGHPPPLVLAPHGVRTVLDDGDFLLHPGLDLGERRDHRTTLARESVLLLYTDGLLDEHRADHDAMVEEVATTASGLIAAGLPLAAVVEGLADALVGTRADDDVAVLAVRVT